MSARRVVLGFALAPGAMASPILIMDAILFADAAAWERRHIIALAAQSLAIAYGSALLIGLPVHLLLKTRGRRGLGDYLLATAFAALLAASLVAVLERWVVPTDLFDNPLGITMWSRFGVALTVGFVIAACMTSWLFWRIAIRPRPNSNADLA